MATPIVTTPPATAVPPPTPAPPTPATTPVVPPAEPEKPSPEAVKPSPEPEKPVAVEPEVAKSETPSEGRINSSLLCYAIAAYAYKYAYEETANAIAKSASGNGIFAVMPIEEVPTPVGEDESSENVEKGKKLLNTPEMKEDEEEIRILCADPETQARTGMTEAELLDLAGLSPLEPPGPAAP